MVNNDYRFWEGKKVFISGHTGFKGSWLSLLLLRLGAKVYGLSLPLDSKNILFQELGLNKKSLNKYINLNNLTNFYGDIRDPLILKKSIEESEPEIVFHLAAQSLVRESYKIPIETWSTNVHGTLLLLESIKTIKSKCSVVIVTSDKVYENNNSGTNFKEDDKLGGADPYSSSKAAVELLVNSWRKSFCGEKSNQTNYIKLATARAGNVIGGGDWSQDRLLPDIIKALSKNLPIEIRNPNSQRPWQHVLDPLNGYLKLANSLHEEEEIPYDTYNFGPAESCNKTVSKVVCEALKYWEGEWIDISNCNEPYEAEQLGLNIDKAVKYLKWNPLIDFETTIYQTINWYKLNYEGEQALKCCMNDIDSFIKNKL